MDKTNILKTRNFILAKKDRLTKFLKTKYVFLICTLYAKLCGSQVWCDTCHGTVKHWLSEFQPTKCISEGEIQISIWRMLCIWKQKFGPPSRTPLLLINAWNKLHQTNDSTTISKEPSNIEFEDCDQENIRKWLECDIAGDQLLMDNEILTT